MRLFYASDVHGSEVCFRKFLNAAKVYKADVLVLGGDLTGKALVPIVRSGESYRAEVFGKPWLARSSDELEKVVATIRSNGFYTVVVEEDEYEKLRRDPALVDELFTKAMVETLRRWVKLAEERLRGSGVEVYIMPGNDDRWAVDEALEGSDVVVNPDNRVIELEGGLQLASLGASNPTPWKTPRELTEEELYSKLRRLVEEAGDPSVMVLNVHVPPYGTPIDLAPALDEGFRVVRKGGEVEMLHAGSRAVRRIIEEYQPLVGLHGHIHESKGVAKIGRTLCFNPGSDYSSGALKGVLLTLERGRVRSYVFTYG
ncbi:MAG: metallophosphoesterase [Thermofilaceae archaeon]